MADGPLDLLGACAFAAADPDHKRLQGLGRGGDHRDGTDDIGHPVSEVVASSFMTAQQGNGKTTRLVQHNDGRVDMFIADRSVYKTHRDTGAHHEHPTRIVLKELLELLSLRSFALPWPKERPAEPLFQDTPHAFGLLTHQPNAQLILHAPSFRRFAGLRNLCL